MKTRQNDIRGFDSPEFNFILDDARAWVLYNNKQLTKTCAECGKEKPYDAFYDRNRRCKECVKEIQKAKYHGKKVA